MTDALQNDAGRMPESDADYAADQLLRTLLAEYAQPAPRAAPADIAQRVLARLPDAPPAHAALVVRQQRLRRGLRRAIFPLVLALLLAVGVWGVYADTGGVVGFFGGAESAIGYLVLLALLSIKPFAHLLLGSGLPLVLLLLSVGGLYWLWRYVLAAAPPMLALDPVEVDQ
ncbi:MAG: hypothetical protein HC911_09620 [Chloroflexaceae bacterium]|nr:hypothetical protein [Chloroflexaceae bacterium]